MHVEKHTWERCPEVEQYICHEDAVDGYVNASDGRRHVRLEQGGSGVGGVKLTVRHGTDLLWGLNPLKNSHGSIYTDTFTQIHFHVRSHSHRSIHTDRGPFRFTAHRIDGKGDEVRRPSRVTWGGAG